MRSMKCFVKWLITIALIICWNVAVFAQTTTPAKPSQTPLSPTAQPTSAPKVNNQETALDLILKGGYVMIPLGLCSLIALTFLLERSIMMRKKHVIPTKFMEDLRKDLDPQKPDLDKAYEFCVNSKSSIGNIIKVGLSKWRKGRSAEIVEKNIEDTASVEVSHLSRSIRVFKIIAGISPLLGLLGTVYGMINAFRTVAHSTDALGKAAKLANGIYEAMVTTAAGLSIAIPVLVIYYFFNRKVDDFADDLESGCNEFMDIYQEANQKSVKSEK